MRDIYTIGHSIHPREEFINLLHKHGINCIVDVRSVPFSKYASQYNKDLIKQFLRQNDIQYIFLGEELGARRSDVTLFDNAGCLDFEKVRNSDAMFKSGIDRLAVGNEKGFRIALMCTEKDPIDCHRSILISKALQSEKFNVKHIRDNGIAETHGELENRLLDMYFPDRKQQTIFDFIDGESSNEDLLAKAYRTKNEEIGYRLKDDLQEG